MPRKRDDDQSEYRFSGFSSPTYTITPDKVFDELLPRLSGAELKILLYIVRRTFGFKKNADDISLSQICKGITTRNGRVLDNGTGLSQSTAQVAIKALVEMDIIVAQKNVSAERGNEPTTYSLKGIDPSAENRQRGGTKIGEGGVPEIGEALYRKSATQETVEQQTDNNTSNIRKVSRPEMAEGERPQVRDNRSLPRQAVSPTPTEPATRDGDFRTIGDLAGSRYGRGAAAATSAAERVRRSPEKPTGRSTARRPIDEDRQMLYAFIQDFAAELHDQAPLSSSVTRAQNLWQRSGLGRDAFVETLYEARRVTQERSATITKREDGEGTAYRRKVKMAYFFSVLEDLLGFKPASAPARAARKR